MNIMSRMRVALAVAMALSGTRTAFGQVLAEHVPADAVIYVGWRGTADPGPGYANSRWAAALKDSPVSQFIDTTLPAIGAAVEKKFPQQGTLLRAVTSATQQIIKKPAAGFLSFDNGQPRWGVYCRADNAADAAKLGVVMQQIADAIPPMLALSPQVVTHGGDVGLLFGYSAGADMPGGFDQQPALKGGLKQVISGPSFLLFVDLKQGRDLVLGAVEKNVPPEGLEMFKKFMDASGLSGITYYVAAAGFSERDWQIDAFLAAPSPRKGVLDVTAKTPFDTELLKRVPASSNTVNVFHLDMSAGLNSIRDIASATDPAARDLVEKVVSGAKLAVGRDLSVDLLQSLGTQWAAYTSSDVGGTGGTGLVLVNHLTNPTKAKQSMAALSIFLSNSGRNLIPDKSISLTGKMIRAGDLSIYYVATPLVAPAWTIKDGYLYMGAYPQSVIEAARFAGASIDSNPGFAAIAKPVDGHQPLAVSYTDVSQTIGEGYATALAGSRLALGLSDMFLAAAPEPLIPSLPALRKQLTPTTGGIWSDDSGLHFRGRSPFPGAETMATLSMTSASTAPMLISILLPSLNRAREQANRIKSMSNLRQIGLGCMLYANDNGGAFPADFGELLSKEELTADVFVSPRTDHGMPTPPAGTDAAAFYRSWVVAGSDYVYIGSSKKTSNARADHILAYEKLDGLTDGINVLFMDSHV